MSGASSAAWLWSALSNRQPPDWAEFVSRRQPCGRHPALPAIAATTGPGGEWIGVCRICYAAAPSTPTPAGVARDRYEALVAALNQFEAVTGGES